MINILCIHFFPENCTGIASFTCQWCDSLVTYQYMYMYVFPTDLLRVRTLFHFLDWHLA